MQPSPKPLSLLILDDDEIVRRTLVRIFRGHEVVAVATVDEALALVSSGKRFDGVVSDVMMPNRTGVDLYRELLHLAPLLASRIVFITGGGAPPALHDLLVRSSRPIVAKPFDQHALRQLVETCARGG